MNHALKKAAAILLSVCLCAGSAVTALAYDDFDDITSHVTVGALQTLQITVPSKSSINTTASAYYITGGSNPDSSLYMNGEEVSTRGKLGSFGVYVGLEKGENVFEFTQDDGSSATVSITRGNTNSGSGGGGAATSPSSKTSLAVGQVVRVTEVSSNVFSRGATSGTDYLTTAKKGATDVIVDSNATMYKLSMGGWIKKDTVKAVDAYVDNEVYEVTYSADSSGERFSFHGTAQPLAVTSRSGSKLVVKLPHTSGVGDIPTGDSLLFTGANVTEADGETTIEFERNSSYFMWGYVVEYSDNVTTVYAKYQPPLSGGDQPLSGITVVLDAGHGAIDPGALGIMGLNGPNEKDITADTAIAVQKRLESLGATVTLVGSGTSTAKSSFVERMDPALESKADFFISLHCNSIGTNQNGLKPNGTEIYYYESIGKNFAQSMVNHITSETGRNSRGVKWSDFRVTLNSCAPSLLVELGFITNPYDYDDMVSRNGIYRTANAIGDSIVSYLS